MSVQPTQTDSRRRARSELIAQYVGLQRDLLECDPSSTGYAAKVQAFRQIGFTFISSGFEDDLDRLLRLRVMAGGLHGPSPVGRRARPVEVHLIEQRSG